MLERASYYGIRVLLVLCMVTGSLRMDRGEALSILGWFGLFLMFAQVLGAILGDLLIGNKKSIILGGMLQTIGAFCLAIPSSIGFYSGLFLVVLGGGLYTPNLIANFGKLYLNKTKLLDSAFTLFYVFIELGAMLGILSIGYVGEKYGWSVGFMLAGTFMLLSMLLIILSKETPKEEETTDDSLPVKERSMKIPIAFFWVTLFWAIYEISDIHFFALNEDLTEVLVLILPNYILSSLGLVFLLPMSLLAFALWTFFYQSSSFKLLLGCLFASISYGIVFLIPELPRGQQTVLYLIAVFFLSISEIHISPIIHSVLTKYASPKYLAIIISLAFIPTRLCTAILGLFNEDLYKNPLIAIQIGMFAMFVLTIALIGYYLKKEELSYKEDQILDNLP
jgi:POT family proton-dependent oligopeptide transporter